jgi:5-methylcytosine-specific restriction endonuclease McrA
MRYGIESSHRDHIGRGAGYEQHFRGNVGNVGNGEAVAGPGHLWLVREAAPEYTGEVDAAGAANDRLLELTDEIVTLSAHIQAATARLLELVAEFDRLEGWRVDGHRTCAHWLAHHTGLDLGAAREKVRVARALELLPQVGERFGRGEVSYAKVRALTRVATPENEADLLSFAEGASAAGVERLVRSWREHDALDEATLERERHRSRRLTVVPDGEGMYVVSGRVDAEVGAVLLRALEAAEDALFERDRKRLLEELEVEVHRELGGGLSAEARTIVDPVGELEPEVTPPQRRADALGLVAEQALARGFGGKGAEDDADAETGAEPISGSRTKRYEVVLHVEQATLAADEEPGVSELEDGTRVSAETSRRLTCDAAVRTMTHCCRDETRGHTLTALGPALDVGRSRRTIPPALRRALEVRDKGCRFPGCGSPFAEGHHIIHWADGGSTSLDNLVLLCRHHHRCVHEDGFTVRVDSRGEPVFATPVGIPMPQVPYYDVRGRVEALLEANRARGVAPDFRTGRTRWATLDDVPLDVRERVG